MPGAQTASLHPHAYHLLGPTSTMGGERSLDAYCEGCKEPTKHLQLDPGSCKCTLCGRVQQLMVPTEASQWFGYVEAPELTA